MHGIQPTGHGRAGFREDSVVRRGVTSAGCRSVTLGHAALSGVSDVLVRFVPEWDRRRPAALEQPFGGRRRSSSRIVPGGRKGRRS